MAASSKPDLTEIHLDALALAQTLVDALEDTKAEDILLLDLIGIAPFTDYFVIASGTSERMLKALLNNARDAAQEEHDIKPRVEGEAIDGWLLADFGDVVLHVFSNEQRQHYQLEELWEEGKILLHMQ